MLISFVKNVLFSSTFVERIGGEGWQWGRAGGGFYWSQSLACRDLNSLTRDQSHPAIAEAQSLNPWTAREIPGDFIFY